MPRVVVLVEGRSDAAALRVLCAARGLHEGTDGFELREMDGVTNVGRHLRELGLAGRPRVLGLCDAPERRFVVRAFSELGLEVESDADLSQLGFEVCDRDLEEELIRALGPAEVERVLAELGELDRFRAFQRQPQWRGRPVDDQLRRFAGTTSGRKSAFAGGLAAALSPDAVPGPLARLVDHITREIAR